MNYVMVIETSDYLHRLEANQFSIFTQKLHNGIANVLKKYEGIIFTSNNNTYIIHFNSVTNAILCALKIQNNFKYITPKFDKSIRRLKIGIDQNKNDNYSLAINICEIVNGEIIISTDVKNHYQSENKNSFINNEHIKVLKHKDEEFLTNTISIIEANWNNPNFNIGEFRKKIGLSKSQFYRKLKSITSKSPNQFIKEYRLQKALKLLHNKKGNISEIAINTGFNSLAYFSKCFKSKFGILPSKYIQQHLF